MLIYDRGGFLPDVVTAPSFIIRKHTERKLTLMDYVNDGVLTPRQREIILEAIRDRKNIIAAGGTKTGKTTFLNAILAEMSKTDDRIVLLEDPLPEWHPLVCGKHEKVPHIMGSIHENEVKDFHDYVIERVSY